MNDDIVERLRAVVDKGEVLTDIIALEAADVIVRLRGDSCKHAEIEQMKAAIERLQFQSRMHSEIIEIMLTNTPEQSVRQRAARIKWPPGTGFD